MFQENIQKEKKPAVSPERVGRQVTMSRPTHEQEFVET